MKKLVMMAIVLAAIATLLTAPAIAGKGGKGGKGGGKGANAETTSSISLDQPHPALGDRVTFTTSAIDLAGWEHPMVQVDCSQDGSSVWSTLAAPRDAVKLGGDASDWVASGGAAECSAALLAIGSRNGTESIRQLAAVDFSAAG